MNTIQTLDALRQQLALLTKNSADSGEREAKLLSHQEYLAALVNLFQMIDASIPEIVHFALGQGVKLTQSDSACLYFLNAESDISDRYFIDSAGGTKAEVLPFTDLQVFGILADEWKPKIINRKAGEFGSDHETSTANVETNVLFVPIIDRDRVEEIGILCGKTTGYDSSDVTFFTLMLDSVLRLVNNKRTADASRAALEQSRQRQAERAALFEASQHLLGHDDLHHSVEKILGICRRFIQAESGFVILVDLDKPGSNQIVLGDGQSKFDIQSTNDFLTDINYLKESVMGQIPDDLPFGYDRLCSKLKQNGCESFLGAPISVDESYFGTLWLFNKPGGFEKADADLLSTFCRLFAVASHDYRTKKALGRSEEKARRLYGQSKHVQEIYESLLQATPDGVLIYDMNKGVTYINPAFGSMFGYSLDEIQGLPIKHVLDLESPLNKNQWLSNKYQERKSNLETKGRTKDGKVLDIDLSVSGFVHPSADVTGILFTIRDLTQPKMLRNQLYQAQKQEALGVLAGGIAHDFNNILSAIIGYTELTLSDFSKEDHCFNHLQQVLKASKRAGDLVQQILAFSRQADNDYRPTNVMPILKETIKLLHASLPSTIEIIEKIDIQDDLVMAAPIQIHQVMMNLCTNARQAMKKGGLLTLTLCNTIIPNEEGSPKHLSAHPGKYLKLTVQDSGTGIPTDVIERIYEPYFTTKIKGEGSGLGLAMVQGIVEMHHGAITVVSEPGFGTTFTVYLPLTDKKPHLENPDPEFLPIGDEKILVVDDEIQLTRLCNFYLKKFGYDVTMVNSSVEALDLFKQNPNQFDMLLTDLTMPKMTGVELLQACREIKPDLPVVICSGYRDDINEINASEKLDVLFLHKPFDLSAMAKSIRMALDQK